MNMGGLLNDIRTMVSRDKFRYIDPELGIELDLAYITPRIIAMGIPSEGIGTVWRNNINDVARFLKHHHREHFLVLNISEIAYDQSKLDSRVVHLPWPDHHAPPFNILMEAVQRMDSFLKADDQNVVAVHCKAGRGRTGTVISCYLMYIGLQPNPPAALQFFALQRSRTAEGVAVPSQIRYTNYFYRLLNGFQLPPEEVKIKINRLKVSPLPYFENGFLPYLEVLHYERPDRKQYSQRSNISYGSYELDLTCSYVLQGDVLIRLYHDGVIKTMICRLQFHTSFIDLSSGRLEFTKGELDNSKAGSLNKDTKISPHFKLVIEYSVPKGSTHTSALPESQANTVHPVHKVSDRAYSMPSIEPSLVQARSTHGGINQPPTHQHSAAAPFQSNGLMNTELPSSLYPSHNNKHFSYTPSTPVVSTQVSTSAAPPINRDTKGIQTFPPPSYYETKNFPSIGGSSSQLNTPLQNNTVLYSGKTPAASTNLGTANNFNQLGAQTISSTAPLMESNYAGSSVNPIQRNYSVSPAISGQSSYSGLTPYPIQPNYAVSSANPSPSNYSVSSANPIQSIYSIPSTNPGQPTSLQQSPYYGLSAKSQQATPTSSSSSLPSSSLITEKQQSSSQISLQSARVPNTPSSGILLNPAAPTSTSAIPSYYGHRSDFVPSASTSTTTLNTSSNRQQGSVSVEEEELYRRLMNL